MRFRLPALAAVGVAGALALAACAPPGSPQHVKDSLASFSGPVDAAITHYDAANASRARGEGDAASAAAAVSSGGSFTALALNENARGRCIEAIDRRLADLETFRTFIEGDQYLTDAHEAELLADNNATFSGLQALKLEVEAVATGDALRAACTRVVDDYRVYLVVFPTARLVMAGDAIAYAVLTGTGTADSMELRINELIGQGADVQNAPQLLADMRTKIAAASDLAAPVADTILPLTPADWNAGSAEAVFEGARNDLRAARDELRSARDDARSIAAVIGAA